MKLKIPPSPTFIRYPGSKAKIHLAIRESMPDKLRGDLFSRPFSCYCEPFFGSGAFGLRLFSYLAGRTRHIIINDIDPGIHALWLAVFHAPQELCELIRSFRPSAELFYQFKEQDGDTSLDPVLLGFRKLCLHQMSFSGLGFMSGGPLGGKKQESKYNPSCRWNKERIANKVLDCHKLMRLFPKVEILCEDFEVVIKRIPPRAFAYLDPPYYVQGPALYKHSMSLEDHQRLARSLQSVGNSFDWILSYDDHQDIRSLYSWADFGGFAMTPTVQTERGTRRKNREVVIRPRSLYQSSPA